MAASGDQFDFVTIVKASETYDDVHRALLKILIDRGSLTERAFCAHFVRCFATTHYLDEIDYDQNVLNLKGVTAQLVGDLLKTLMEVMNEKVQHIGLRLMKAHDEARNKKTIVLVCERHFSPAMAASSAFSAPNDLFLVVSWLEEMLKPDNDGYFPVNAALRSVRELPVPMKMEKSQQLIDQLLKEDWVRIEAGDMLTLTTRALTELGPILRSRFNCATCSLCSNVTIRKTSMLSCDRCECLLHPSCWNNFAATSKSEKVRCPVTNCKNMISKGEMAETIEQIEEARKNPTPDQRMPRLPPPTDEAGPSKRTSREKKARHRKRTNSVSDEEGEAEAAGDAAMEEDDDDVFVKQTPKKSRKQPRRSSMESSQQQRKRSKDDEEEEEES